MEIKDVLEVMILSIVDDEDSVALEQEDVSDTTVSFKVSVGKDDVGKIIGTKGRIASALRTVAKAAGAKKGVRVLLNVDKDPLER